MTSLSLRLTALRTALLALACVAPLVAGQPVFKSDIDLVTVSVNVTNRSRTQHIDGLGIGDFRIFEDGVRQELSLVSRERRPVSVCIVVDASGSMAQDFKTNLAVRSGEEMVRRLEADDEAAIVVFRASSEVVMPWTRTAEIKQFNWQLIPSGDTSLNDGLRLGLKLLEGARNPRRAILLITDGFENSSRQSLASVVTTRRQSEAIVYAFGIGAMAQPANGRPNIQMINPDTHSSALILPAPSAIIPAFDYLETLVGDSGGTVTRMESSPEATMAARNMIDDLRYQYTLGYSPSKPLDGKYRRIKVEVARGGLYVRHRGGYLAMPNSAGK